MHIQGLSEKLGGPGQIFVLGALFFSKMLASGGKEVKFFFRSFKKGSKNFSGRTSVKLRFKKIVSGQIPVPTLLKLSPAVIYIKKRSKKLGARGKLPPVPLPLKGPVHIVLHVNILPNELG
jgi:hypothetical protein